jgi:hypothetical protein
MVWFCLITGNCDQWFMWYFQTFEAHIDVEEVYLKLPFKIIT